MMKSMDQEQLVDKITREVLSKLEGTNSVSQCEVCPQQGTCVERHPEAVREIIRNGASRIAARPGIGRVEPDLAGLIDHTLLKPEATRDQIENLCREAERYGFASVCVNPTWVCLCADLLRDSKVKVCTVVGFPLGANTPSIKAQEVEIAQQDGATEIDTVMNIGALKSDDLKLVAQDMGAVVSASWADVITKVIIEAALLTDEEKVKACAIAKAVGMDYVKTSTGFGPGGATSHDVALMRRVVGRQMGVKAAGGIRDYQTAREMVAAGASRIGASASVKIVGGKG